MPASFDVGLANTCKLDDACKILLWFVCMTGEL
jgi:hypothetical protein